MEVPVEAPEEVLVEAAEAPGKCPDRWKAYEIWGY